MELDQAASLFRSAWKQDYLYQAPPLKNITLITDRDSAKSAEILASVQRYLAVLGPAESEWTVLTKADFQNVKDLIIACEQSPPDLIVTYRHLWTDEKDLHHSLGVYLDMLTQATSIPVLVLPHLQDKNYANVLENTDEVMVITDHLSEDQRLVDYGVRLTSRGGKLFLAHVESKVDYKRYINIIGKIPDLNTEIAEEKIANQLLKEPRDFILACTQQLAEQDLNLEVIPLVTFGHTVRSYRELLEKHQIALLVMNTKDGEQLAMHGDAYSIAVEFTHLPLLML